MARTALTSQLCACGRQGHTSITVAGTSLRETPRRRSHAITVYICNRCERNPSRATRRLILESVLTAALELE